MAAGTAPAGGDDATAPLPKARSISILKSPASRQTRRTLVVSSIETSSLASLTTCWICSALLGSTSLLLRSTELAVTGVTLLEQRLGIHHQQLRHVPDKRRAHRPGCGVRIRVG